MSDHTWHLATELTQRGEQVHIWCPTLNTYTPLKVSDTVFSIHRMLGNFDLRSLRATSKALRQFPRTDRIIVQWVPHGYGLRAMNLPFCLWIWTLAQSGHRIDLWVHQTFVMYGHGWKQNCMATVQRLMTAILLQATSRLWLSTATWCSHLRPYRLGRQIPEVVFASPSNIPPTTLPAIERRQLRASLGEPVIGRFGHYGGVFDERLMQAVVLILQQKPSAVFLFLGTGSDQFCERFRRLHPSLAQHVRGSGWLSPTETSRLLQTCDVMLQYLPDGLATMNTSVMALLDHGLPTVVNRGRWTESWWASEPGIVLVDDDPADMAAAVLRLLEDPISAAQLAVHAVALYRARFSWSFTVERLLRLSHIPTVPV